MTLDKSVPNLAQRLLDVTEVMCVSSSTSTAVVKVANLFFIKKCMCEMLSRNQSLREYEYNLRTNFSPAKAQVENLIVASFHYVSVLV